MVGGNFKKFETKQILIWKFRLKYRGEQMHVVSLVSKMRKKYWESCFYDLLYLLVIKLRSNIGTSVKIMAFGKK